MRYSSIFFLGSLLILQSANFDIGDRKQERRRKSMYATLYFSFFRKSPVPSKSRFATILHQKSSVRLGIQTRLARTECHCSTACATTTSHLKLMRSSSICQARAKKFTLMNEDYLYWVLNPGPKPIKIFSELSYAILE